MTKSVLQDDKCCFVCMKTYGLHRHHIYFGSANRRKSEKYGCWVYLCPRHHNMSDNSVHFNKLLDLKIKKMCQKTLEKEQGWTREKFMAIFRRNYLD